MGFFSNLFRRNPTADWHESAGAIAVDVVTGSLMGKGFAAPMDDFCGLGPATGWPGSNGCGTLRYPGKGIEIDFEYGQFIGVLVLLKKLPDATDPDIRVFSGKLLRSNAPLGLGSGDDVAKIRQIMGEPESYDEDEDETVLMYRFDQVCVEFEVLETHGLAAINLWHEGDVTPTGKR
jgi:hypothetical protein